MSSSVTNLPALTAALKQLAPSVSMATMGTSVQPTSWRPWTTPQRRPPPPTEITTAPGFTSGPREAAASAIILAWPCLSRFKQWGGVRWTMWDKMELSGNLLIPEQWVIKWGNICKPFSFSQSESFSIGIVPNLRGKNTFYPLRWQRQRLKMAYLGPQTPTDVLVHLA